MKTRFSMFQYQRSSSLASLFFLGLPTAANSESRFPREVFNVLNHANWNGPTTSITSGTFEQILTFLLPRIIQFAMKFLF
jgi:hypothetical protein